MNELIAPNSVPGLVLYEAARRALAEAKSVDEVLLLRTAADQLRAAAHIANNRELEADAAEIRMRAERRVGEMIAAQKETVGLAKGGEQFHEEPSTGGTHPPVGRLPTLGEAGIDKNLANRARGLAAIPKEEFEKEIGAWRENIADANERITVNLSNACARPAPCGGQRGQQTPPRGQVCRDLCRPTMGIHNPLRRGQGPRARK